MNTLPGFAKVHSRALVGVQALRVTVEVHLTNGLPSFNLVGLAETEVKEARERVRCAIQNTQLQFPANKRITVNLAPADLPKDSGRFDLPIALGLLAASGQIDAENLEGFEFAGELSLAGDLRPVRGALAMGLGLSQNQVQNQNLPQRALVLPPISAQEAALATQAQVYEAAHLLDTVAHFSPQTLAWGQPSAAPAASANTTTAAPASPSSPSSAQSDDFKAGPRQYGLRLVSIPPTRHNSTYPDMADVKGQSLPKRALEIAAAGRHSVLLVGPPGTGKSMLAQRFLGLLPPLSEQEALESAAVLSLAGQFHLDQWGQRPLRSPHHTASAVALVGGGSPPKPGEVSLAHHGVLFLDELPEFPRSAVEALREPLEQGQIHIARAAQQSCFPAQFQLIGAMNPCPCGHLGSPLKLCRCKPEQISRYQRKLSGPLLDRIDMYVEVPALSGQALLQAPPGESTAQMRQRIQPAFERALARQGQANGALQGAEIDQHCVLDLAAMQLLNTAAKQLAWSGRSTHRVLKLARTVADLDNSPSISPKHMAEAIQYRRGLQQAI